MNLASAEDFVMESNDNTQETEHINKKKRPLSPDEINDINKRYQWTIPTYNRYQILTSEKPEEPSGSQIQQQEKKIKIPPIYLHEANCYQEIDSDLQKTLKSKYTTQHNNKNSIKINTTTTEDFRALTTYYDQAKLKYHTFSSPDERLLSVVLRSVPLSLTEEEIKNELIAEYPVKKVVRLLNREKQPMPLCVIDLENNEKAKEIFNLRYLMHAVVSAEPRRKPRDIPQCTRCQRYGHTKNFCKLTPRCVKCQESHHFTECKKDKDTAPTCVNCGNSHPANYKGCAYYQSLKSKILQKSYPTRRRNEITPVTPNVSFSDIAKNLSKNERFHESQPTRPQEETQDIIKILLEKVIDQLIPKIQDIISQALATLFTKNDK